MFFLKTLDLCPNKGDKSSYSIDEYVIVNILNNNYEKIELYKKDTLVSTNDISLMNGNKIIYSNLLPGEYSIRLSKDGKVYSNWANFEVLDNTTIINNYGDIIEINFESVNAIPEFVSINSLKNGAAQSFYDIPNIVNNKIDIPLNSDYKENYSIRVIYKGKYGRVFFQYELP